MVLAHSHTQCADLPVKFHWGSPLPLLTYSFVHLILSFLLPWRKRTCVTRLPLAVEWRTPQWRGLLFNCGYPVAPLALLGQKMGTKGERCQLMWPSEDVLDVRRDVNHSLSHSLLPPSLPVAPFLYLAAFRACGERFWDPGNFPLFFSPFVRESLFSTWGLAVMGRKPLHCFADLRHFLKAPQSHGKG